MTATADPRDGLAARIAAYRNTAQHNDALHEEFTRLTDAVPLLKSHRDWVERHRWGYGDRAFHYMWWLLLADRPGDGPLRLLEIGVFKGQILSLWAAIARELERAAIVTGISPFSGNAKPAPRWLRSLRKRLSPSYRAAAKVGNLHHFDDYLARVAEIFAAFDIDPKSARLIKGYSTDPAVIAEIGAESFDIVYIDGDHSYDVALADLKNYGPLVAPGGYLVIDDAAFFLPGEKFWKGFESVSRAAEILPALGFDNVLNIGHNRVFRRRAD